MAKASRHYRTTYEIEIWRGMELVEVVAVSFRKSVAMAAFLAACRLRLAPGLEIVLRHGLTVIASRACETDIGLEP